MSLPPLPGQAPLFDHVDRCLTQMHIPLDTLKELKEMGSFRAHDFQLDGVEAVNEDGTHTETPELARPTFEWRKYGAPGIGLQWRQVPVDPSVDLHNRALAPETMAMQKRMTERAYQAYLQGGGGFMGDRTLQKQFIISDREKNRRRKEDLKPACKICGSEKKPCKACRSEKERSKAAKSLQARIRTSLMRPMYPWLYIARMAQYKDSSMATKKTTKVNDSRLEVQTNDAPELPWCQCWTSLEPTYELDVKSTQHMRQIVMDFELENFESCLRRVDNLLAGRRAMLKKSKTDHVLVELVALCNRFGVRLFFLGRIEHSHAFFERVMRFTNSSSGAKFAGKAELFSWTCDLVGYCLWIQKKYEQSHWTISRSAPSNAPFNCNLVNRLHATQVLIKLDKPDLVVALGSKILVELMQARHEHTVAVFLRKPPPNFNQILKVVEHLDERGHQTASPSYLNLLCHQAQTIVYALARSGRREDAATINRVVRRQATSILGKQKGVSNDLVNCINDFEIFIDPMTTNVTMNVLNHSGASAEASSPHTLAKNGNAIRRDDDEADSSTVLDGVALAEETMRATNARLAESGLETTDRQALLDTTLPRIPFVASGVVGFEPPKDEPAWAKEFFSDIYWQRHSNLRVSKQAYTKSISSLAHRHPFR